jgi:hypothetical protein
MMDRVPRTSVCPVLPPGACVFETQVERLVRARYGAALGISDEALRARLEPLRPAMLSNTRGRAKGSLGVLVVVACAEAIVPHLEPSKGRAFVDLRPKRAADFRPIDGMELPAAGAYLLAGVDTGADLLDVTPEDAMQVIRARRRWPLTIEEGVALLVQYPGILEDDNAFSLLGSRCGDQRVPALWTSRSAGRVGPRLGWCWARNPHSWLGSASCSGRHAAG